MRPASSRRVRPSFCIYMHLLMISRPRSYDKHRLRVVFAPVPDLSVLLLRWIPAAHGHVRARRAERGACAHPIRLPSGAAGTCRPASPVPSTDAPRQLASLYHPAQATGALTPAILTSLLILRDLPNFVADLALSARLLAVYPPRTTPRAVLARVLGPAVAVKFARAASMAVIGAYDGQIVPGAGLFVYWSEWERAWLIANRALTVVDNACVVRAICPCSTLTGVQVPDGVLPVEAQARVPLERSRQGLGPRQYGRRGCASRGTAPKRSLTRTARHLLEADPDHLPHRDDELPRPRCAPPPPAAHARG
jgi:hypothetical protein